MTINYDVLQDPDSNKWFFIIFGVPSGDVYESDAGFDSEGEAEDAAVRWIADNLLETPKGKKE
jgi:hypothetical protein